VYRDLRPLADKYDRILEAMTVRLTSEGLHEGQVLAGDLDKHEPFQRLRAGLHDALTTIAERGMTEVRLTSMLVVHDRDGRARLRRTKELALHILGHLSHLHPDALAKTVLPQARRQRQPWPELKARLLAHFRHKYPHGSAPDEVLISR
jgi:hypothetical protein